MDNINSRVSNEEIVKMCEEKIFDVEVLKLLVDERVQMIAKERLYTENRLENLSNELALYRKIYNTEEWVPCKGIDINYRYLNMSEKTDLSVKVRLLTDEIENFISAKNKLNTRTA